MGSYSPPQEGKATQRQVTAHYCTQKPATLSQKKKKLIRQDATVPKQKAVTDYKEQVDRHTPHPYTIYRKTKKQENQYNHNGHNNQKPNQWTTAPGNSTRHIVDPNVITAV